MKGFPYILVPDYNIFPMIMYMTMMAKIMGKIFGPNVVTINQQMMAFTVTFIQFRFSPISDNYIYIYILPDKWSCY